MLTLSRGKESEHSSYGETVSQNTADIDVYTGIIHAACVL